MNLPKEYENVIVTFEGTIYVPDGYYGRRENAVLTKRGFYHKSDGYYNSKDQWVSTPNGYFSIPPRWRTFNGILLPDGWGGYRITPENVIQWRELNESEQKLYFIN